MVSAAFAGWRWRGWSDALSWMPLPCGDRVAAAPSTARYDAGGDMLYAGLSAFDTANGGRRTARPTAEPHGTPRLHLVTAAGRPPLDGRDAPPSTAALPIFGWEGQG